MQQDDRLARQQYVRRLLEAYRTTPGTTGRVSQADRQLAAELYKEGVPLAAIDNALILAAARRLFRPRGSQPLGPVRSLHYFRAVIDEVANSPISQEYFHYLRGKIASFRETLSKE